MHSLRGRIAPAELRGLLHSMPARERAGKVASGTESLLPGPIAAAPDRKRESNIERRTWGGSELRRLRTARRDCPRRDGRGLSRAATQPRAHCRAEDD